MIVWTDTITSTCASSQMLFSLILHHAVKIPILIFTHTLFKYYSLVHKISHYSHLDAHSHDLFPPKGRIFLQKFVSFPCPWYIIPWKFGYSKFPFHKNVTEISLIVKIFQEQSADTGFFKILFCHYCINYPFVHCIILSECSWGAHDFDWHVPKGSFRGTTWILEGAWDISLTYNWPSNLLHKKCLVQWLARPFSYYRMMQIMELNIIIQAINTMSVQIELV